MDAEPGGGDLRGVTRDSSMDLASHHWSTWTDLKSGRRRSGAEISAGSVEALTYAYLRLIIKETDQSAALRIPTYSYLKKA